MGKLSGKRGPDTGKGQAGRQQDLIDALLYVEELASEKQPEIRREIARRLRSKEDGGYEEDPRTIAADVLRILAELAWKV